MSRNVEEMKTRTVFWAAVMSRLRLPCVGQERQRSTSSAHVFILARAIKDGTPKNAFSRNPLPAQRDQTERHKSKLGEPLTDHEVCETRDGIVHCQAAEAMSENN